MLKFIAFIGRAGAKTFTSSINSTPTIAATINDLSPNMEKKEKHTEKEIISIASNGVKIIDYSFCSTKVIKAPQKLQLQKFIC